MNRSAAFCIDQLAVDPQRPTPAYLQLKHLLMDAIQSGALPAGEALPSERRMAEVLNLSRMTIRRALGELEEENLIERRLGSGTYVLPSRLQQTIDGLQGFSEEARTLGSVAGSKILELIYCEATERVAKALKIPTGDQTLRITRLRTADSSPLAIQIAHVSPRLARFPVEEFQACGSLYQTVEKHYHIRPVRAIQTLAARLPTRTERKLLAISSTIPVLDMERTTYDASRMPFEYVRSAYRGDRYQMLVDLRAG